MTIVSISQFGKPSREKDKNTQLCHWFEAKAHIQAEDINVQQTWQLEAPLSNLGLIAKGHPEDSIMEAS